MERKEHYALTKRQREIAQMALALLDLDQSDEYTLSELQETLEALTPKEGPPTRVEYIPVRLRMDATSDPVGFGTIAGETLFIQVKNETLVNAVAQLAHANQIAELYLGLGFPVATPSPVQMVTPEMRERVKEMGDAGYTEYEISKSVGIPISLVRLTKVELNNERRSQTTDRAKELKGFNYTNAQIATQLGLDENTVRRILEG